MSVVRPREPAGPPRFSLLLAVGKGPRAPIEETVASMIGQSFDAWELVCTHDGRTESSAVTRLRSRARRDPRIVLVDVRHGRRADALAAATSVARGAFIASLVPGDGLDPDCLARVAAAIEANPATDYLYTDEDGVTGEALEPEPPKPDWSPERFRCQPYTGQLSMLRTALVRDVGGFRRGFAGAELHDLLLRVTERARSIVHLPEVLFHRAPPLPAAAMPDDSSDSWRAGVRAVREHLARVGVQGLVRRGPTSGTYRIVRTASPAGLVSVIIPTRGSTAVIRRRKRVLVLEAVRSLIARAGSVSLEIVVVHDVDTPDIVLEELRTIARERLILIPYDKPFNFSEKCNIGALGSHGRWLLMLNDDTEVITPGFVQMLVAPLLEEGVGMTGAHLLLEDGSIQHAGVVYRQGSPGHAHYREPGNTHGVGASMVVNRECSALTAACIALRRSVFEEVGGFCEELPVNYGDTDLSLKVRDRGLRLLWLAGAKAYHYDSRTRDPKTHQWERDLLAERWPSGERDAYLPWA